MVEQLLGEAVLLCALQGHEPHAPHLLRVAGAGGHVRCLLHHAQHDRGCHLLCHVHRPCHCPHPVPGLLPAQYQEKRRKQRIGARDSVPNLTAGRNGAVLMVPSTHTAPGGVAGSRSWRATCKLSAEKPLWASFLSQKEVPPSQPGIRGRFRPTLLKVSTMPNFASNPSFLHWEWNSCPRLHVAFAFSWLTHAGLSSAWNTPSPFLPQDLCSAAPSP
nr:uncharacterized protein LOC105709851 [Aotus nancymaae]